MLRMYNENYKDLIANKSLELFKLKVSSFIQFFINSLYLNKFHYDHYY